MRTLPPDTIAVTGQLPSRIAELGVDLARVLAEAKLPPALLQEPGATIDTRTLFSLWIALERCAPRDVALRLADQPPGRRHLATRAALCEPNLRSGLRTLRRYKRLTCPEELSFGLLKNELHIHVRWVHASGPLPALLVEAALASLWRFAQHGTGTPLGASRVELAHARTLAAATLLEAYFGCPLRFDAPVDALVLEGAALELPFVTRDAGGLDALVPGLEARLPPRRSFAEEVSAVMHHRWTGHPPKVRDVARAMGMSQRSLQRRLAATGTTYQSVLDESRREAAARMLANTDLQLGQVAFLLGFQEVNSFFRAFHAWEGTTPSQWRKAQGGKAKRTGRRASPQAGRSRTSTSDDR